MIVQTEPSVRLSVEVEPASVTTPINVEAFAFSVRSLPLVTSARLLPPALAIVLLKLTVEVEGSAKIRSPEGLLIE